MIVITQTYCEAQEVAQPSIASVRSVRVIKKDTPIIQPSMSQPKPQSLKSLQNEWAEPIRNREITTKEMALRALGGTNEQE